MSDAPEVKVRVSGEDAGVQAAIKQLSAELKNLKNQEKETAAASLELGSAFETLLKVVAVEKILEFGKEVFDSGVKIARLSQAIDISSEVISVFVQATKDAGGNVDDMQAGIAKLAVTLTQADQGNQKAAKSLALVGLSTKDFIGLNADQKLRKVTDALGAMPPGFQKVAAAQKLFGDGAEHLLPALTALAGEGFAHAREEAERFGNILSTQAATDLLKAQEALKDLEAAAEGAARQFETGIVPALTDVANAVLNAASGPNGADGFKVLGEEAGTAIKGISYAILSIGTAAGITAAEIEEVFDFAFNHTKEAAKSVFAGIGGYIRNGITGAAIDSSVYLSTSGDKATKDFNDRMYAILKTGEAAQDKIYQSLYGDKPSEVKKPPPGKDPGLVNQEAQKAALKAEQQADELFKLHIASLIKQVQSELEIGKAFAAAKAAEETSEFERGLISLKDYFEARRREIEQAGRAELDELTAQRAIEVKAEQRARSEATKNRSQAKKAGPETVGGQEFSAAATRDTAEALRAKQAIADLDTKIQIQTATTRTKLTQEDLASYKAALDQLAKLTAFRKTILDLQGKTSEAAKIEADAKESEYRLLLTSKFGAGSPQIEAEIAQYRELTTAAAAFNDARKAGEDALKSGADERAAIELQVTSGKLFQFQADEQIEASQQKQIANLRLIAAAQLAAAIVTGNAADKQTALDFKQKVDAAEVEANQAAKNLGIIKTRLESGLKGSFEAFFDSGIVGARNLGQAFAGLADGVVGSLRKIVAQILATKLTEKLLEFIPGLGGKTGSAGGDGAQLVAGAAAVSAASIPLTTAGGTLLTAGAAITASAIALQESADTLLLANDSGGDSSGGGGGGGILGFLGSLFVPGKAGGGLISGPGGPTSDSILARLSPGEFVIRAAAVRSYGVHELAAINRGLHAPAIEMGGHVTHFAEGGLVQGGNGQSGKPERSELVIGLEEGIVLKHMSSRAGGKVVVQHLANNPKQASKALGRSS
jgi:hypothetical protein